MTMDSHEPLPVRTVPARRPRVPPPVLRGRFAALDFETADYGRDSACALSIIVVEDGAVVEEWHSLIRPPRREFVFTYLHGIAWRDVEKKPVFREIVPELQRLLSGVDFAAAHNASFDRSVMRACGASSAVSPPDPPFVCTVKLARKAWQLRPAALPNVCRHLNIPLRHHDAGSDARACARIVLAALQEGHAYADIFKRNRVKGE